MQNKNHAGVKEFYNKRKVQTDNDYYITLKNYDLYFIDCFKL